MRALLLAVSLVGIFQLSRAQTPACSSLTGCSCQIVCMGSFPLPIPANLQATCAVGVCCCSASAAGTQCREGTHNCVCERGTCPGARPHSKATNDCPSAATPATSCCCADDPTPTTPAPATTRPTTRRPPVPTTVVPTTATTEAPSTTPGISTTAGPKGPDYCHPSPCHNLATCVMKNGTFVCECRKGFTGRLCQNRDCQCSNGGMCTESSFPVCECPYPWYGDKCQYYKKP